MSVKPKKIATADLPIYTWTPDQVGQSHLARIGELPVIFSGSTSEEARAKAENFRIAEMEKHVRKDANVAAFKDRTAKAAESRKRSAEQGNAG
jgi:hypothetical protein